jgi:hypothetical protein
MSSRIKNLFEIQRLFNKEIYGSNLSDEDLDRFTQDLALCAHSEISSLISATQYKKHHSFKEPAGLNESRIVYESVDVIRYIMAILNLWDVDFARFEEAFYKKDIYLHARRDIDNSRWMRQPVVIVDIDDVLAEFREGFAHWLEKTYSLDVDIESPEYYFIDALKDKGLNPEKTFLDFVDQGGFFNIKPIAGAINFLKNLQDQGYWIHLLTARPEDNLTCLYDTYAWLAKYDIPFNDISFSAEKFRWCAQSKYYDTGSIIMTIDDSPKHATEYAIHGLPCLVPEKSYNRKIWNTDNVFAYRDFDFAFDLIKSL